MTTITLSFLYISLSKTPVDRRDRYLGNAILNVD
jgi:hypothetical protein